VNKLLYEYLLDFC